MKKIRIHCFEPTNIEGFPSNTYETDSVQSAIDCVKELFENNNSGISRILIENPYCDSPIYGCYGRINATSLMEI